MTISILDVIDRHVTRLETVREPDGKWHPSSISGCARKAVYTFRGTPQSNPPADKIRRVFRVGHILHGFAQEAMLAEVGSSIRAFYAEVKIDIPELNITGSVDGVVELYDGTWVVLEFKSISSFAFKAASAKGEIPKPDHVIQALLYLYALRQHGAPEVGIEPLGDKLEKALVVYLEKQDMTIVECPITWDPWLGEELVERAMALRPYETGEELPDRLPPGPKGGRHWECGYCPYEKTCYGVDK